MFAFTYHSNIFISTHKNKFWNIHCSIQIRAPKHSKNRRATFQNIIVNKTINPEKNKIKRKWSYNRIKYRENGVGVCYCWGIQIHANYFLGRVCNLEWILQLSASSIRDKIRMSISSGFTQFSLQLKWMDISPVWAYDVTMQIAVFIIVYGLCFISHAL